MKCASPLKLYPKTEMFRYDHKLYLEKYPLGYMEVPCGKCLSCRIARAREWALRLQHEREYWESACFLTLTYSDENLPSNGSISKSVLQLFFKRLRKKIHPGRIRYYACGEYGEKFGRPHYHAIIYGLPIDYDFASVWPYGLTHSGFVSYDSCRYVAQYIDKKYYGEKAEEVYLSKGLEVPFQISSQGLGLRYALSDSDRIIKNLFIPSRGKKVGIPRYYKKKLNIDPGRFSKQTTKKLFDVYKHYYDKGLDLNQANLEISKARKQANATLKAKTDLKKLRNLDKSL